MGTRKNCAWMIGLALITQLALLGCTGNGAADLVDEGLEASESPSAGSTSTGAVTLTWYTFPDGRGGSPGQAELADSCVAGAGGRYTIEVEELSGLSRIMPLSSRLRSPPASRSTS